MTTPLETTEEPVIKKKISIKVWGVGGAGCNTVSSLDAAALPGVDILAVNTDCQALESSAAAQKLVLGARRTRGLGAGGDPELGRAAAEEDIDKMRAFCGDADIIFILAGLGGGTGTGAAPVLARMARERGALVLAIVTMPFEFEGNRRQQQAQAGLRDLKAGADAVICLPNQKLFKLLDEKTSVLDGFKISNGLLAQGLHGIWRLLSQPGLINVDFADLCSVTRGRHAASSFATAEACGESRVEQVAEKLLAHPLLDGGQVLSDSDAVLVSLVGGPDLTMAEINKVMEPLNRQCENAHIILGAAIDEHFGNRLSVTLIASCQPAEEIKSEPSAIRDNPLHFLDADAMQRPASRFQVPPPELTPEQKEKLLKEQTARTRRKSSRLQRELPLEIVYKGRFEKSEPTIRHGEDLDVPTYIRRGVPLN
ncbi:MAG TPA: cell division protein FtsZ [Candidatus Saccharimonadales bacterium]|nr:cell division protein FtsZ [Candidatus Saccharimonadales bacterium]